MKLNKNTIFYVIVILLIFIFSSCMTQNVEKEEIGNIITAEKDFYAVEIEFENKVEIIDSFNDHIYIQKDNVVSIASSEIIKKGERLLSIKNDKYSIKNIQYIESVKTRSMDSVVEALPINSIREINFDLGKELDVPSDTLAVEVEIVKDDYIIFAENSGMNIVKSMENSYLIAMTYEELINNGLNLKIYSNTPGTKNIQINSVNYSRGDNQGSVDLEALIVKEFYFFDFLPADFNRDGFVNLNDLYLFRSNYREEVVESNAFYDIAPEDSNYLFNGVSVKSIGDSVIGLYDFLQFVRSYNIDLGRGLVFDLPEDYNVLPIYFNPPEDSNHYIQMEIYTINEYVEPQEYLKTELFFDYNNKLGEFILTKDLNQDETGLTKYSAILKIPDNYSVNDFWDFYIRYVRNDGIKSVIPGELENISTFRLISLEKAKQINQNTYNYSYIVKYWEDIMPKKQIVNATFDNTLTPWVDIINVMKKIRVEYSSTWNSEKISLDYPKIEFEHYDFFLSEKYSLNSENEITEETENQFSAPFAKKELFDNGDTVQIKPMSKYNIRYTISDTTNFASISSHESTVFLGEDDWDYFLYFNYEYEKFLKYAEANDEYFAVEENYNNIDYGYDFDLDGLRDIYFREWGINTLEDAKGYVVQDDFNNIYNYDKNKENSYANIRNNYFDSHVLLFNTGEKYIKLQVIGETTIDATFVNEVMNWGDSQ